jgi:glycosyltransferase involved in cell wall biosynthesis
MAAAEGGAPLVSVVIPVYNEVENLPILWKELEQVLPLLTGPAEVVFVDDGSTDGSDHVIREILESDHRVRCVRLRTRCGLTAAFQAGYAVANGDVLVTLDGDLQSDPRDIPALLAALDGADAAVGWRRRRYDSVMKRVASRVANAVRRRVLGDVFRDSACSVRAMRRRCLAALPPYDGMHRFVPVLLTMNGYAVVEVPVTHRPRRHGRSKFGIRDRAWRAFVDLLAVRWMRARRLGHLSDD